MSNSFFDRRILGIKRRGVRLDPQTRQNVQVMPHSGDIAYDLSGNAAVANKSEYITPSRERTLAPVLGENLNEIGQNQQIIKRTQKGRVIELDKGVKKC